MGNSVIVQFQGEQIRVMINALRRFYVVWPLTDSELFLIGVEQKKTILASLYRILSLAISVRDMVKELWACNLGMEITEDQWCRIHKFHQAFSANLAIREQA